MPETIPVAITGQRDCTTNPPTGPFPVVHMNFKEYVKGVLPAEWGATWNEESLKAGAIAVKMFAISMVERRGYVYDCNWSQVYYPKWRTEATDKAVDDTWNYILLRDDKVFTTYYDNYLRVCILRGAYGECMGQWNSKRDAEEGMNFEEILYKYYNDSSLISTVLDKQMENNKVKLELDYNNPYITRDYLYMKFLKEEHKYD